MTGIVEELSLWVKNNERFLHERGVELACQFSPPGSNLTWKANIGLVYDNVGVSYTVWEMTCYQTELIVVNGYNKKTVAMEDNTPEDPKIVHQDLDLIVKMLLDGSYKKMDQDPKLRNK